MLNKDYLNLNFCTFHVPKFEHDASHKKILLLPSSGAQGDCAISWSIGIHTGLHV